MPTKLDRIKCLIIIPTFLLSLTLNGQDYWQKGHYYDIKGKVYHGQISYEYDVKPSFKFRQSISAKEKKIKSWKSTGFVIEKDSFTVIQNFELFGGQKIAHDFAQVIEVGPIVLLKNYSRRSTGGGNVLDQNSTYEIAREKVETYILTKPGSDKLWVVYPSKKSLESLLKDLKKDFPQETYFKDLLSIEYKSIPEIISEYNRLKKGNDL